MLQKCKPIYSHSPCVRNCCLNDDDICLGCFRSIEEIMQWGSASEEHKQQILCKANTRKQSRIREVDQVR